MYLAPVVLAQTPAGLSTTPGEEAGAPSAPGSCAPTPTAENGSAWALLLVVQRVKLRGVPLLVQYLEAYSSVVVGAWTPIHVLGAAESRIELTRAY
jgi:hypothetical protein